MQKVWRFLIIVTIKSGNWLKFKTFFMFRFISFLDYSVSQIYGNLIILFSDMPSHSISGVRISLPDLWYILISWLPTGHDNVARMVLYGRHSWSCIVLGLVLKFVRVNHKFRNIAKVMQIILQNDEEKRNTLKSTSTKLGFRCWLWS